MTWLFVCAAVAGMLLRPSAGIVSPSIKVVPKKVVAVGATGALGRSIVGSLAEAGSEVLVLSRQPFLASAKERVSHDYGTQQYSRRRNAPTQNCIQRHTRSLSILTPLSKAG